MLGIKVFLILVLAWFGFVYFILCYNHKKSWAYKREKAFERLYKNYMKGWRFRHYIGESRDI